MEQWHHWQVWDHVTNDRRFESLHRIAHNGSKLLFTNGTKKSGRCNGRHQKYPSKSRRKILRWWLPFTEWIWVREGKNFLAFWKLFANDCGPPTQLESFQVHPKNFWWWRSIAWPTPIWNTCTCKIGAKNTNKLPGSEGHCSIKLSRHKSFPLGCARDKFPQDDIQRWNGWNTYPEPWRILQKNWEYLCFTQKKSQQNSHVLFHKHILWWSSLTSMFAFFSTFENLQRNWRMQWCFTFVINLQMKQTKLRKHLRWSNEILFFFIEKIEKKQTVWKHGNAHQTNYPKSNVNDHSMFFQSQNYLSKTFTKTVDTWYKKCRIISLEDNWSKKMNNSRTRKGIAEFFWFLPCH